MPVKPSRSQMIDLAVSEYVERNSGKKPKERER
jgi:metal-responsive CopG/Arc/MetJ family transcriptional regulator